MQTKGRRAIRILFIALVNLVLVAVFLEAGSYLLFPVVFPDVPSRQALREELSASAAAERAEPEKGPEQAPLWMENHMLHPYTGYVGNPTTIYAGGRLYTKYGFPGPPLPADPEGDDYIIAITGGSVAMSFYYNGSRPLRKALMASGEFEGKTIRFVCLALQGFKQPQQLMALTYMLAQGQRFDMVINLDGFNEVVLPVVDNFSAGVSPIYPRSWNLYALDRLGGETLTLIARQEIIRQERAGLRRLLSVPILKWSNAALAVVALLDERKARAQNEVGWRLRQALEGSSPRPEIQGPAYDAPLASANEALARSVSIWQTCSIQMHWLCAANGVRYAHFLQPNQYVPDSKKFTEAERREAYREGPYRDAAMAGYPYLAASGEMLREAGVAFTDLTDVYVGVSERIYVDDCCHVNELGNRLLAQRIAASVTGNPE